MLTRQREFSWHFRMRRDAATTHLPHGKESVCFKLPRVLQIIRPLKSVELGVCEVLIIINPPLPAVGRLRRVPVAQTST